MLQSPPNTRRVSADEFLRYPHFATVQKKFVERERLPTDSQRDLRALIPGFPAGDTADIALVHLNSAYAASLHQKGMSGTAAGARS